MVLELYQHIFSPPSRAVMMVGKLLKLPIEIKPLNLMAREHLKPEFLKINPFHCVPTLVDDGFALWESRAIMTYLVDKYAPGNLLYPTGTQARAVVDRWLYWDAGSIYPAILAYYIPIRMKKGQPAPTIAQNFFDKLKFLDDSLSSSKYVCGNQLTLADLSLLQTMVIAQSVELDVHQFKNVAKWLKQLEKDLSCWDELVAQPIIAVRQAIKSS